MVAGGVTALLVWAPLWAFRDRGGELRDIYHVSPASPHLEVDFFSTGVVMFGFVLGVAFAAGRQQLVAVTPGTAPPGV